MFLFYSILLKFIGSVGSSIQEDNINRMSKENAMKEGLRTYSDCHGEIRDIFNNHIIKTCYDSDGYVYTKDSVTGEICTSKETRAAMKYKTEIAKAKERGETVVWLQEENRKEIIKSLNIPVMVDYNNFYRDMTTGELLYEIYLYSIYLPKLFAGQFEVNKEDNSRSRFSSDYCYFYINMDGFIVRKADVEFKGSHDRDRTDKMLFYGDSFINKANDYLKTLSKNERYVLFECLYRR